MTQAAPAEAETVLEFWFGEIHEGFCVEDRSKLWFQPDPFLDQQIAQRFGGWLEKAVDGRLQHWCENPRGRLALILLLDQFSRNIHRGTERAFAHDNLAVDLCLQGMRGGHDLDLVSVERTFYYLPLEHSEKLEHQELCVSLFERMMGALPGSAAERVGESLSYAIAHRDIVRRFGRFPHRNRILARESTEEELRYLEEGGATFGQG